MTNDAIARQAPGEDMDYPSRQTIEDEIERLIAMLDEADPDPDLEPSLAGSYWAASGGDDREDDGAELEPSLASPECHPIPLYGYQYAWSIFPIVAGVQGGNQSLWANGGCEDIEFDDSDLEHGGDDEASLGWTVAMKQDGVRWLAPSWLVDVEAEHDGREPCCEDEGAQCDDEGHDDDDDTSDPDGSPVWYARLAARRQAKEARS
jgi:hypothetical protein